MSIEAFELAEGLTIAEGGPVFIAGPCVIESEQMAIDVAGRLVEIAERLQVSLVFKSSFDKANRSSINSFRGPGLDEGLRILEKVKRTTGLAVLTDVHDPDQARAAALVVDVLQVPAFLCRQTDLLLACGETGSPVNVKKGQFLAAEDMSNVVDKISSTGNRKIMLTERGSSFGYHNLVVDMRGLPVMRRMAPVVFDVTHSLQLPGGLGHATGGARDFHPHLARAAAAVGVDGFFVEVHPDPSNALSDATTQLSLVEFERLVPQLLAVNSAIERVDR
ncbi:MAG: 3-deoxy-8-phosphooctulonate synthase [bacterium]|nr:3-deoxy-8-phosphooctulonate synthase [bacterium]